MKGLLSGLKILDLTRVLSGPYCTMVLADLGAEVVKLEQLNKGDDSREYGPFLNGQSAYFMGINRNKQSITINLKEEKGRLLFLDLVKNFDVVIENFRPGTMDKLGIGYETVKSVHDKIIYASISGFGQTGPMSRRAAYDGIVQAMGGIMSINGEKNGRPLRIGVSIGDIAAGMFCAIGILAATLHRNSTNEGMYIDVAMLDSIVAILESAVSRYQVTGIDPKPNGNTHASIFPFETFPTSDGEIMIAAGNDRLWAKLCNAIERVDLIEHPLLKTNPLRDKNHDFMYEELSKTLTTKTTDQWYDIIDGVEVPCSPINTVKQVIDLPQIQARNTILEIMHPIAGSHKIINSPIKTCCSDSAEFKPAPVLGSDNENILKKYLNYSDDAIAELRKTGVIGE